METLIARPVPSSSPKESLINVDQCGSTRVPVHLSRYGDTVARLGLGRQLTHHIESPGLCGLDKRERKRRRVLYSLWPSTRPWKTKYGGMHAPLYGFASTGSAPSDGGGT